MDPRDVQLQRQRKEPAPDGPAKTRAKKNTKRWCRGRVGREHQLAIVDGEKWMTPCGPVDGTPFWETRKSDMVKPHWHCRHQLVCLNCTKIMEYFLPGYRCPLWPNIHRGIRMGAELVRWTFEDLGPDRWGWNGFLVKEGNDWAVLVLPMLVNDRIIIIDKANPKVYDYGWCYDAEHRGAILAAAIWDPEREGEPIGFIKRVGAYGGIRKPG